VGSCRDGGELQQQPKKAHMGMRGYKKRERQRDREKDRKKNKCLS
jgi:hypothetical protein